MRHTIVQHMILYHKYLIIVKIDILKKILFDFFLSLTVPIRK